MNHFLREHLLPAFIRKGRLQFKNVNDPGIVYFWHLPPCTETSPKSTNIADLEGISVEVALFC